MNLRSILDLRFFILVALSAVLFFSHLDRVPFFNKGEPREALVVQDIVLHGDWLFPLKRGEEIPSKPPLFHWVGSLASLIRGRVTEATVRFPSALFATLGVLVLYIFGRRLFGSDVAFFGGIILATSVGYQSQAIAARVDMTLVFFVTLTLVVFYCIYQSYLAGSFWIYVFFFLLGVSVFAKGPVGVILPGMIISVFLGLKRRWDFLARLFFHKGTVLTFLIAVSWYGMALVRGGEDFFNHHIINENLARFFVHGEGGSGHQKPFYYYPPYLILEGLPWSLFLPFVVVSWFKNKSFADDRFLFLVLWAGLIFLFFSLSAGKRSVYLLPLYPPLALLTALWLGKAGAADWIRGAGLRMVGGVCLIIGLAFLPLLFGAMIGEPFSWILPVFESVLKPKDLSNFLIVQENLDRAGWLFPLLLLLSAFLWISAAFYLFARNGRGAIPQFALLSVLTGLLIQSAVLPAIAESKTYKPFMMEVNRRLGEGNSLFIYGEGWDYTSVVFYRGGSIPVLKGDRAFLRKKLLESDDYYIMSERERSELFAAGAFPLSPMLRSRGRGPDGKDPIVLIRGLRGMKEK